MASEKKKISKKQDNSISSSFNLDNLDSTITIDEGNTRINLVEDLNVSHIHDTNFGNRRIQTYNINGKSILIVGENNESSRSQAISKYNQNYAEVKTIKRPIRPSRQYYSRDNNTIIIDELRNNPFEQEINSKPVKKLGKDTIYKYKLLLKEGDPTVRFVRFPEEYKELSIEEIIKGGQDGSVPGVSFVNHIPKKGEAVNDFIIRDSVPAPQQPIHTAISGAEFIEKTSQYMSPITEDTINALRANAISSVNTLVASMEKSDDDGSCTCRKGVILIERGRRPNSESIYYLSTGVGNIYNSTVECIRLNLSQLTNTGLHTESNFTLVNMPISILTSYGDSSPLFYFLNVTVKTIDSSVELFGAKAARKNMVNKTFSGTAYDFYYERNYYSSKKDNNYTCVMIKPTPKSNNVRFLASDVEFSIVDPNKLTLKKVSSRKKTIFTKNMVVKITDDRRLSNFKKGDKATLISLTKNKNNTANSKAVIKNEEGITETLFLKQIKPYANAETKKEISEQILSREQIAEKNKQEINRLIKERAQIERAYHESTDSIEKAILSTKHSSLKKQINELAKGTKQAFSSPITQNSF